MYTILIPAYNEEKTIRKVLKIALKAAGVGQIILVDDGSSDKTVERACGLSSIIEIISHQGNRGKGVAVRSGIAHAKFECIVFVDADLLNITPDKIAALAEPILTNQADFVKASFTRARGRVTEIAVKPMMQILFPNNYFEQPISGQFAARLSFLKEIKIVENWGLDIGILLDAISRKQRIVEVFIGELEHKAQSEHSLAEMSEQVLYTMIQKAGFLSNKYKLALFSFDETILKNYSTKRMMAFFDKGPEFQAIEEDFADRDILPFEYYSRLAALLEGISTDRLKEYVATLELRTYAADIVEHLQRRRYKVGLIGMHFHPVMKLIAQKLNISIVEGLGLKLKDKKFTGELNRNTVFEWFEGTLAHGYLQAMSRAAKDAGTDLESTIVIVSGTESLPMIAPAGLSVAYRAKDKYLKKAADKTISILPELLMLVE
jgi:glucosyl-3-phosphoglycerate synthase